MMLTVGSLFAGIGGLELGLEQTGGFKTIWSVENDKYCNEIRRRHWPDVPQYKDVREFPPPEGVEQPDLICGGSPCQDLSVAGKRAGIRGNRSGLFAEMVRIIRILQPKYVVWENVRGVFSSGGGADFRAVLGNFSDLGYNEIEWTMLRASDFGYPHGRARVFVVAYRPGARHGAEPTGLSKNESQHARGAEEYGHESQCSRGELANRPGARREGAGSRADVREEWGGECVSGSGRGELADADGRVGKPNKRESVSRTNGWDNVGRSGGKELETAPRYGGRGPERQTGRSGRRGVCETGEQPTMDDAKRSGGGLDIEDNRSGGRDDDASLRAGAFIPFAPPGPNETDAWREIIERWPWLAPAIEPQVCMLASRFSNWMDRKTLTKNETHCIMGFKEGQKHANAKKRRPEKELRILRKIITAKSLQRWTTGRPRDISTEEILRQVVHGTWNDPRQPIKMGHSQKNSEIQKGLLREVRGKSPRYRSSPNPRPPQRPKLDEQQPSKSGDPVWLVSFKMALAERKIGTTVTSMQNLRKVFRSFEEQDVPKTLPEMEEVWRSTSEEIRASLAKGIAGCIAIDRDRAPRLRALGNAVVPACAQWVGEKILEWEKQTT